MSLKLRSITFESAPRIPGVRPQALSTVDCDNPHTQLTGWRVLLRGPSMFLVSPKGWKTGQNEHEWDQSGSVTIHEIPRQHVFLQWEGDFDDVKQIAKGEYESPAFGGWKPSPRTAPKPILAQLDSKEMGDA